MLVLTRKLGETIVIDDNIIIKVVDIHGKQIRLGIEAPTEITIFRGEIHDRIQEENRKAASAQKDSDNSKQANSPAKDDKTIRNETSD
jgi:carbon storage regulator